MRLKGTPAVGTQTLISDSAKVLGKKSVREREREKEKTYPKTLRLLLLLLSLLRAVEYQLVGRQRERIVETELGHLLLLGECQLARG